MASGIEIEAYVGIMQGLCCTSMRGYRIWDYVRLIWD